MCGTNINKCCSTFISICREYEMLFTSIYNIIPNDWCKNTFNSYHKSINVDLSNIKIELNNLIKVFPQKVNLPMEILAYMETFGTSNFIKSEENLIFSNTEHFKYCMNIVSECEIKIEELLNEYQHCVLNYLSENNDIKEKIILIQNKLKNINSYIKNQLISYNTTYMSRKQKYINIDKSIAIIIPTYNAKATLNRALNSIAEQTIIDHIKVKIYVVNDCSEYNYQDLIKCYSSFMDVEELELNKNVGPGIARQNGIDKCKEDYIVFIDSDDLLYRQNSLEKLFDKITKKAADLIVSNFKEEGPNGYYRISNNMGWLHGKIYRTSFIKEHNISFLDSRATEDAAFNMLMKIYNPKIDYLDEITYIWTDNKDSITRKNNYEFSFKFIKSYSENIRKILQIAIDNNANIQTAMEDTFNALFVIWTNYITFNDEDKKKQVIIWTQKLKRLYDTKCKEYITDTKVKELFHKRKFLYNDKWTPSYAEDCFNDFLKKIDSLEKEVLVTTKEKINLLISIDEEYTCQAVNMLKSIIYNNDIFLDVYILYNKLSIVSINSIIDFLEANNYGKLHTYFINAKEYNFPQKIQYISDVTYYRLFAPFIIKEDIDRLLYLDSDIIVTGKINDLYNIDFEENIIVGCKNMLCKEMNHLNNEFNQGLGLPVNNEYINAGVILIDIPKYKKFISEQAIMDFINENQEILKMQDQDVINKLFYKKIKIVDNKYNFQINTVEEHFVDNDIRIVHYSQRAKPWHLDYYSTNKAKYYYKFLAQKGDIDFLNKIVDFHLSNLKKDILKNALNSG